jgi:DNA-directed RNA polymerase specialized sigma24 family protein
LSEQARHFARWSGTLDADDLLHSFVVHLCDSARAITVCAVFDRGEERPYLRAALAYFACNTLKKQRRRQRLPYQGGPSKNVDDGTMNDAVQTIVKSLPVFDHACLWWRMSHGFSWEEIAQVTGRTVKTVRKPLLALRTHYEAVDLV